MGVDNPGGRRQPPEWARRDEFDDHRTNAYAHGELIGRLQQEGLNVRERFENRISALERFRSQAVLVGGVALVILGSVAGVIVTRLLQQPLH